MMLMIVLELKLQASKAPEAQGFLGIKIYVDVDEITVNQEKHIDALLQIFFARRLQTSKRSRGTAQHCSTSAK